MIGQDALAAFIQANLRLAPARAVPEIVLWQATPASRLRRLQAASFGRSPYWAYQWAGGTALARFVLDRPETVAGRRVLDLGCGGGIVAIAAARAGAAEVLAVDVDPAAVAAATLNAAANDVRVAARRADLLDGAAPEADFVLVGDLFYATALASRTTTFLSRCRQAGIDVLVGDPFRAPLPLERLRQLVEIDVPDFGGGPAKASGVFAFVGEDQTALKWCVSNHPPPAIPIVDAQCEGGRQQPTSLAAIQPVSPDLKRTSFQPGTPPITRNNVPS